MHPRSRLSIIIAFLPIVWATLLSSISAQAEDYPTRPITLVVPFGAGGGIDIVARIFAARLQEQLHQPVVVENRAGAGGIIGTSYVAHATPDGYTLLLIEASSVLAKWLHKDVPFHVTTDFTPVAMVATTYLGLFAGPSLPVTDIEQLVTYSKAHPGKLSVGTPGVGTPHHLAAMMLNRGAGTDITNIPYRGTPASVNDLISGQIPLVWAVPVNVMSFVELGKARLLAVSSPQRLSSLPKVPTIAETVLPGFSVTLWLGIASPAGTPPEIITRLSQAVQKIAEMPDVQNRVSAMGYNLDFRSGDKFREQMLSDHEKYGVVIRDAGIHPK
jgi:tripartite-type tricarboxylate transporter receptor subunit TctC